MSLCVALGKVSGRWKATSLASYIKAGAEWSLEQPKHFPVGFNTDDGEGGRQN